MGQGHTESGQGALACLTYFTILFAIYFQNANSWAGVGTADCVVDIDNFLIVFVCVSLLHRGATLSNVYRSDPQHRDLC